MAPAAPGHDPAGADRGFPLLTIGYGNARTSEEFTALLRQHGIRFLVDVRTRPYSRMRPEFSRDALEAVVRRAGIRYIFMGDTLGGLPSDPTCYRSGKVDYVAIREKDWFTQGLDRLEAGWRSGHRIALVCAELEPQRCHRSKLIGEALVARGVAIRHIDESGKAVSHAEAMDRLTNGQAALFDVGLTSRIRYRLDDDAQEVA